MSFNDNLTERWDGTTFHSSAPTTGTELNATQTSEIHLNSVCHFCKLLGDKLYVYMLTLNMIRYDVH
jgi:hypothetical protein